AKVSDFLFYPPQAHSANDVAIRHFEFSVPEEVEACIGITSVFYSLEAYKGQLEITNLKVYSKTDNIYEFTDDPSDPAYDLTYNPDPPDRASVKAFKLALGIDKKGEKIDNMVIVIPIPNNGVTVASPEFASGF
ncbi:MAG: hypothetical protein FWH22_10655, partial [Fibromonadales bacterium]|nr:hypothetical protein [Fibromonadales bacterium]